jgi:hypothetical protein
MIEWLKQHAAPAGQIDAYELAWSIAMKDSGAVIPCPRCFLVGQLSGLNPRTLAQPGRGASSCEVCKTRFEYPDT